MQYGYRDFFHCYAWIHCRGNSFFMVIQWRLYREWKIPLKMANIQEPLWKLRKKCNTSHKKTFASYLAFIHNSCVWHLCKRAYGYLHTPWSVSLCQRAVQKFLLLLVAKELLLHLETARKAGSCPISPGHSLYYLWEREVSPSAPAQHHWGITPRCAHHPCILLSAAACVLV